MDVALIYFEIFSFKVGFSYKITQIFFCIFRVFWFIWNLIFWKIKDLDLKSFNYNNYFHSIMIIHTTIESPGWVKKKYASLKSSWNFFDLNSLKALLPWIVETCPRTREENFATWPNKKKNLTSLSKKSFQFFKYDPSFLANLS